MLKPYIYYFYDCNNTQQTFRDKEECRKAAIEDGTTHKYRDNLGGEYFI